MLFGGGTEVRNKRKAYSQIINQRFETRNVLRTPPLQTLDSVMDITLAK